VIVAEHGKFLLKRRPQSKKDSDRVAFAHAVQRHLAEKAFPVAALVPVRDDGRTVLELHKHIYECFEFVTGVRYDGSAEATGDAGSQLADLHSHLADFAFRAEPTKGSFHDSSRVRKHLKAAASTKPARPDNQLRAVAEPLMNLYNASCVRVNALGFDSWTPQVVHGDWHPGNMLFAGRKLVAVLDFDSLRLAPAVTDLANGMLQFSIVGGRPNPADWPAYFDQAKMIRFLDGYLQVTELAKTELDSLVDLMIEAIIAEAILPVAATGSFGPASGLDFIKMIQRKAQWLNDNRKKLTEAIES
jgi:homoserine kinase type II